MPQILAKDVGAGLLLLEDLGDDSFTSVLKKDGSREPELYEAAIDLLAQWHTRTPALAVPGQLALPAYDEPLLMKEVGLFCDWYLPQVVGKDKAEPLREEYHALWQQVLARSPLPQDVLVHRDYHADNLMWLPGRDHIKRVGLLDFQDGVYGAAAYDLVSLLEDARRDVPPALADAMLSRYIAASGADRRRFLEEYALLGAQRNSKIVGIFLRLAARDGKEHYLHYLPRVWRHLERDLMHPSLSELRAWHDKHIPPQARGAVAVRHNAQELALSA